MPRTGLLIAITAGIAMIVAGVDPWLVLGVVLAWLGSLWLSRPEPDFTTGNEPSFGVTPESIVPFIEPLGVPLLLLDDERIIAANKAAREALGGHITGQDARVALRHPLAVELLGDERDASVTIPGLTTTRSIWQLSRFRIDSRYRLIECVNRTAEADISRAHTDFVANASHELRTPLASIIGYLETLGDPAARVDEATSRKFVGTMESEARRMKALVEDLLSLSRIEAEKHDAPRERIDLARIAAAIAKDVAGIHGEARIAVDCATAPAIIWGDHAQIDQLVRNLVDNALKYGDADKPVSLAVAARDGKVVLTVTDRGPGIAREHLPHLTRRFYRTDPGRSRASGGTGLGLAIVKHIVERHRGKLDIASTVGVGTTVTVQLPQAESMS